MGTSPYTSESFGGYRDHPHACGDKSLSAEINRSARGSSPRVWGQEIKSIVEAYAAGIIPTRVGTSHCGRIISKAVGDHPHACGDKGFEVC